MPTRSRSLTTFAGHRAIRTALSLSILFLLGGLAGSAHADDAHDADVDVDADADDDAALASFCDQGAVIDGRYTGTLHSIASANWDSDGTPQCFTDQALEYTVMVKAGKKVSVTPVHKGSVPRKIEPMKGIPAICAARPNARERRYGLMWTETWTETWKRPGQKVRWEARAGFIKMSDGTTRFRYDSQLYVKGKMMCYALFE